MAYTTSRYLSTLPHDFLLIILQATSACWGCLSCPCHKWLIASDIKRIRNASSRIKASRSIFWPAPGLRWTNWHLLNFKDSHERLLRHTNFLIVFVVFTIATPVDVLSRSRSDIVFRWRKSWISRIIGLLVSEGHQIASLADCLWLLHHTWNKV